MPPFLYLKGFRDFSSNFFTVLKAKGSICHILDQKTLKVFTLVQKFFMESINSVIASLDQGDFLPSVDIKYAYLYVSIFQAHRRCLHLDVGSQHFRIVALTFGLPSNITHLARF